MADTTVHVGFTATRDPLEDEQLAWVRDTLTTLFVPDAQFHHGDCVGGDEFGATVAWELGYQVVSHPPTSDILRAYVRSHLILARQSYLKRNRDIVGATGQLVAVPPGPEAEHPRSGTWYTVRVARRAGKPLYVWEVPK